MATSYGWFVQTVLWVYVHRATTFPRTNACICA